MESGASCDLLLKKVWVERRHSRIFFLCCKFCNRKGWITLGNSWAKSLNRHNLRKELVPSTKGGINSDYPRPRTNNYRQIKYEKLQEVWGHFRPSPTFVFFVSDNLVPLMQSLCSMILWNFIKKKKLKKKVVAIQIKSSNPIQNLVQQQN